MKVILLHGDNGAKVAERLTKFIDVGIKRNWKIERIDPGNKTFNMPEVFSVTTLFKEEKLFILDNISKVKKSELEWLKKNALNISGTLIVVGGSQLSKTAISSLPKLDSEESYELPKKIWAFLDSFYPGNFKLCLTLFHEVIDSEAPELVVALLARHLKDLYIAKVYPESLTLPPWRAKKLGSQADKFTDTKLQSVINLLARADFESKTGQSGLTESLDLLIMTKLE